MSTPKLLKSWQFNVNQQVGSLSTTLAANQSAMQTVKSSLKGFSSNPWLVWGSCNGHAASPTFGNGDGVDNWVTPATDLIWLAAGSNHSWMVLRQPGLLTNTALCLDLSNANSYNGTIVLSPSAGFGAANGGTNGTATARPTATDEVVLLSDTVWGGYNGTYTWRVHVLMSSDGRCTRVLFGRANGSVALWMIESVKNPISTWSVPIVGVVLGASDTTSVASYANLSTAAAVKGKMGSDACTFYMSGEAFGTTSYVTTRTAPDDDSGEWPLFPIGLIQSSSAKHRGRKGELYDCWWGSGGNGDTYPDDSTKVLLQHGNLVHPWNGSTPYMWI